VRNRALRDQLHAFSQAAAERLNAAIADGAEIPFEVAESPGAKSVLYRYRPLSGQFVRERMAELRAIEGYVSVLLAVSRVEGTSAYLRVLGETYAPTSERDRSDAVLREFLARLYEDMTTFEFDEGRFERAYAELESAVYDDTVVTTVLAPVLGVQLADERWELGSGLALARGDECEAPSDAIWAPGRKDGQPNTLVSLTVEAAPKDPPPLTAARLAFRKLLTTLRLFKRGSATLGPSAWWRLDDGPWQALPLGFSGHMRAGDYWLEGPERDELLELFELVRMRPLQGGPSSWALTRFEMGCGQAFALEGLSDYLLALSALLDGDDTVPAGVPKRLAALCAEPAERDELRAKIEEAFALERRLMRGELDPENLGKKGSDTPDRIVAHLESTLRAVLKDIICGYLDTDVKHTADELLRGEAEARPDPEPDPKLDPLLAFGAKLRGRGRKRKAEPVLESWEEVLPPEPSDLPRSEDGSEETQEHEFVVRSTKRAGLHVGAKTGSTAKSKSQSSSRRDSPSKDAAEQETQETFAVAGVREVTTEEDLSDWGFDDDPKDYSAAV
jgi:hypothetical protein